jgi:COMPASS component SWD2
MAIDSPMGANGLGGKSGGALPTAQVSEMISLFRPTKVIPPSGKRSRADCMQHFRRDSPAQGPGKLSSSQNSILSLDFDDEGGLLLTSESDNSMQIYNVKEGKHHKTLLSQKYGVMHAMFGHASGCIIHSSTKQNSALSPPLLRIY